MAFQNADTRLTEVRKENWFDKYLLSFHYQLFSKRVLVSHVHAVCARNCIIFHRRQRSHDFHCVKSRAVLTNAVSPGVNLSGSGVSLHIHKSNTHTYTYMHASTYSRSTHKLPGTPTPLHNQFKKKTCWIKLGGGMQHKLYANILTIF